MSPTVRHRRRVDLVRHPFGRALGALLCVSAVVAAGCTASADPTPDRATPRSSNEAWDTHALTPDDPIVLAERFLQSFPLGGGGKEEMTPESVVVLDYVSRRWGRPILVQPHAALAALDGAGSHPGYARLFDPSVRIPADDAAHLDSVMGPMMFCQDHPLPDEYPEVVRAAIDDGGYESTHALLALVWAEELGCEVPHHQSLLGAAIDQVARELAATRAVTDLAAEQIAFLDYAGVLDRVDPDWERRLVDAQLDDGGWPEEPDFLGRWHTAIPAWWALLAFRAPGDQSAAMLPG